MERLNFYVLTNSTKVILMMTCDRCVYDFRKDCWKLSEIKRMSKRLNSLELPKDILDKNLVPIVKASIQEEIQYQCDVWNAKL